MNKIVYVVMFNVSYEQNIVKGVFENKKEAEKIAKDFNDKNEYTSLCDYSIEEMELNKLYD